MEKDFLTIDPSTGEDNSVVSVTSEPNTGRQTRTTELTVNAQNTAKSVSVEQLSNLFIEIDGHGRFEESSDSHWIWDTSKSIIFKTDLSAQRITLTGKSNSKYLMLFKTINDINNNPIYDYAYDVPTTALINGENKNILNEIPDDPGLMQEYSFSIDIDLPQLTQNYTGFLTLCVFDGNDRKMISLLLVFNRRTNKTEIIYSFNNKDLKDITYEEYESKIINFGSFFILDNYLGYNSIIKDINDKYFGEFVWRRSEYTSNDIVFTYVKSFEPIFSEENNPNSLPNYGLYPDHFINRPVGSPLPNKISHYKWKVIPGIYNIKILPSTSQGGNLGNYDKSKLFYSFNDVIANPTFEWAYNSHQFIELNNVVVPTSGILSIKLWTEEAYYNRPVMNLLEITEA